MHGTILSSFFQWSIKSYCQSYLQAQLTYNEVHWDGTRWILQRPKVISDAPLTKGGYVLAAESATVGIAFGWDSRPWMFLDVALAMPYFNIGKGGQEFKKLLHGPVKDNTFFSLYSRFCASEGKIDLNPLEEDGLAYDPLFFNIDFSCDKNKTGTAKLFFGDKGAKGVLQATFLDERGGVKKLFLQLEDVKCEPLAKILKNLFPDWTECKLSDGLLKGNMQVTLPAEGNTYIEGNAAVRNLAFCHSAYEGEFYTPELTIEMSPKNTDDGAIATVGRVGLSRCSTIAFAKNGQKCWAVEALDGGCSFQDLNQVTIDLEAMCRHAGDSRLLRLKGGMEGLVSGNYALKMNCQLHEEDPQNDTIVRLTAEGSDKQWEKLEFDCAHLTKSEFDFIQNITKRTYSHIPSVNFSGGAIDMVMEVALNRSKPSEINVRSFTAHHLDLSNHSNWAFSAKHASGSLLMDCTCPDPLKALSANLALEDAKFSMASQLEDEKREASACCFSNLQGLMTMHRGEVRKSSIQGMFAGLKGKLEINDSTSDEVVSFEYEGDIKVLSDVLPPSVSLGIKKTMAGDQVKVTAQIKRSSFEDPNVIELTGKAAMIGQGHADNEMVFGINLKKDFGPRLGEDVPLCWWDLARSSIKNGWFDAKQVPLEKFVSPFIFQQDQIRLSGKGTFHGLFDGQGILLQYDAQNMVMENADFCIEINSLSQANAESENLPAKYYVDFDAMCGKGSIPLRQGTYFEKNSGLLFTDVNTVFHHEDGFGRMPQIEAFCNGIYFNGQIELDWSQPGPGIFDVDIKAKEMLGKMSQMQQLCTHFNKPLFFLKIPLDGNLALRALGGHLHFAFNGGDYDLHARIDGSLADGVLMCPNADMIVQEIGVNFSFDHIGNTLDFFDIQGTLLVGKPNHVEEYAVVGERVHFSDYHNDEADFDLWVGDKKRDILRLAGKTRKVLRGSDGEPMLSVMLDHSLSHFGDVYPSVFQLTIKDWSQIESLKLVLDLQIKTLLCDLQRFSRTGLMFLSRSLLKGLNNLKAAEGNFNVDLSYDGEHSLLTYELSGNDIALGKHNFRKLTLSGNKKDNTWSIEQLQLDDISLAADLLKDDHAWKVNFLGARVGDALLAGLEGQYLDDAGKLEAKINLLEVDLSKLQAWPALKSTVEEIAIAGHLRATGKLNAEFNLEKPKKMCVEIDLEGALNSGILQGLHFEDIENASLHYKTGCGLTLKNIRTGLKDNDDSIQAGIFLQKVDCSFSQKELIIDKLFFRIPSKNLENLTDNIQRSFPHVVKNSFADVLRSLKYKDGMHGEVQGALTFELSEPHCALRLSLNDGIYHFMGKEHDVKGFVLEYDPFELKISSIYRLQQEWLSATIRSTAPALDSGEIVLLDNPHLDPVLQEYFRGGFKPLTIRWQIDPQNGFYIHKLEGRLRGVHVDLMREPSLPLDKNNLHLAGHVQVDMNEAHVLLDPEIAADLCSWKVGNGYGLQGLWTIDKNSQSSFSRSLSFHGKLQGKEFEFFGYQFNSLSAQVSYERGFIHVQNLLISDPCGSMHVAESVCAPVMDDTWEVKIPFLALSNFRPGLLRALDGIPPSVGSSLNIRQLELQEVTGVLGDRNSFTGRGRLAFVNPPRKNLQSTIFAIPAELLTRIGLDLAVLTPVRGAIYYRLEDGKVKFTKFKDIYSKGRLSKFYLPNNGYQSCVDFDGNLDLQIRMKQYNLVFKLAELFTVNIQGSLNKPSYSLNKQQK